MSHETCSLRVRIVFSAHGISPCITNSWMNTLKRSWSLSVRCAPHRTGNSDGGCVLTVEVLVIGPSATVSADMSCVLNSRSVPFRGDGAKSPAINDPSTWQRISRDRDRLAGASGWSIVMLPSTTNYSPTEGIRERTEYIDIFLFSVHHSIVFCFRCSVYWWKGSVRF